MSLISVLLVFLLVGGAMALIYYLVNSQPAKTILLIVLGVMLVIFVAMLLFGGDLSSVTIGHGHAVFWR